MEERKQPQPEDAPLREEDVTSADRLDDRVAEGEDLPAARDRDTGGDAGQGA